VDEAEIPAFGFGSAAERMEIRLDFSLLRKIYEQTPGLSSDKLKAVLELVWSSLSRAQPKCRGIVLAYDESQNLSDQASAQQYPLSLLLDVFQSLQKKGLPFLLVLTGLPTLFPKLVEARTFAERMFHVVTLGRLAESECREAILKPVEKQNCPVAFSDSGVKEIVRYSGGYPYFVQFLCREMFDAYIQQKTGGIANPTIAIAQVIYKLDTDFFTGRWSRVTDRQRELLAIVSELPNCDDEFSVQEIVEASKKHAKPFSASHVNQMLATLIGNGLVYKNRHGRYAFAVPLLGDFIRRHQADESPSLFGPR
jgi:hypothetical protein